MKTAQGKSSIPDEIFYDIFSRLPVKSLMRFKCVSKSFKSLFMDPYFVDINQIHSMYRSDKTKFLVRSKDQEKFYTMDLKLELNKPSISHIEELDDFINWARFDYVKGLICLWNTKMSRGPVIYSLSTRKVRSLPHPNLYAAVDYCSLGFEPDKKKYKILMITGYNYYNRSPKRYWVFTLGTDESWREIKGEPCFDFITVGRSCTKGAIYLLGYNKDIIEFNVRTENFRNISFPKDIRCISIGKFFNLIELEEKLVAIHISTWKMGEMNLWILESSESSEEWVKHTIALHQSLCYSLKYLTCCFCSTTPDGEIVFITNTKIKLNWIFFYNWKKKSWRSEILELEEKVKISGIYSYVDSLLHLGCI